MIGGAGQKGRSGSAACCCIVQKASLQMKRQKTTCWDTLEADCICCTSSCTRGIKISRFFWLLFFALKCQEAIISTAVPESLMCLRASVSQKEDISFGDMSDIFSKPRKLTLLQYTTRSASSGLSLEQTWGKQTQKTIAWLIMCVNSSSVLQKQLLNWPLQDHSWFCS